MAYGITNVGTLAAWATITVNYPEGAELSVTNIMFKKDISSTQRIYTVKRPQTETQTCVVTITNGEETKEKTVTVTKDSAITVNIAFQKILFYNGVLEPMGEWLRTGGAGDQTTYCQISGANLKSWITGGVGAYCSGRFANPVDLTPYDYFEITFVSNGCHVMLQNWVGIVDINNNPLVSQGVSNGFSGVVTLNISSLTSGCFSNSINAYNQSGEMYLSKIRMY